MKATKPTPRPKPSLSIDPNAAGRALAAAEFGVSPLSIALWEAAGMRCGAFLDLCPTARTIDEVAAFMGVSGRTIGTWKTKGMPGGENGEPYCLPEVLAWRRSQPEPEAWHLTGSRDLKPRDASGDLARAILRLVRYRVRQGAAFVVKDFIVAMKIPAAQAGVVEFALQCALTKHLIEPLVLTDQQIESTLADCWHLV